MQMIFSGSVTQGPNSAAFSGTKKRSPAALALEHGVDGRRRAFAQLRFGLDDVEDAALGADAEAVFAALAERREGHALRQLLRAGRPMSPQRRQAPRS